MWLERGLEREESKSGTGCLRDRVGTRLAGHRRHVGHASAWCCSDRRRRLEKTSASLGQESHGVLLSLTGRGIRIK